MNNCFIAHLGKRVFDLVEEKVEEEKEEEAPCLLMSCTVECRDFSGTKTRLMRAAGRFGGGGGEGGEAMPDLNHLRSDPLFVWLVVRETLSPGGMGFPSSSQLSRTTFFL